MGKKQFDLEHFPTSESAKRQLSYVSDGFYDESYIGKWLFQVMGLEYDKVRELFEDLPDQFFPETATWALRYHEEKWGLPIRENLSYEERRRLIFQKRDFRAPMTPYLMEQRLGKLTGFEVHIADINDPGKYNYIAEHPNVFKVYFLGRDTLDSKAVHKLLNSIKQSHTLYTVNDRIEDVIDMSGLEHFNASSVYLYCSVPFWFWKSAVLDGTWLLDGNFFLDTKRNYDLVLGMKCKLGDVFNYEYMDNAEVLIKQNPWTLDGSFSLDGSKVINSNTWKEECL